MEATEIIWTFFIEFYLMKYFGQLASYFIVTLIQNTLFASVAKLTKIKLIHAYKETHTHTHVYLYNV